MPANIATQTETTWVRPARRPTSTIPVSSSPVVRFSKLSERSEAAAWSTEKRDDSQIVALSIRKPSGRSSVKTSPNIFGPVVGNRRSDPRTEPSVPLDTRYSGFRSEEHTSELQSLRHLV